MLFNYVEMTLIMKTKNWLQGKTLTARSMRWLAGFLTVMAVLTVVSRGAYGVTLPRVQVQQPEKGYVNRRIQGGGKVTASREESLRVPAGLWVQTVYVREGSLVKAGDLLFRLDPDELEASLQALELEKTRLELSLSDGSAQRAQAEASRERAISRAEEDLVSGEAAAEKVLEQAAAGRDAARQALEAYRAGRGTQNEGDDCEVWDPETDVVWQALMADREEKVQALWAAEAAGQALLLQKQQALEAALQAAEQAEAAGMAAVGETLPEAAGATAAAGETLPETAGAENQEGHTVVEREEIRRQIDQEYAAALAEAAAKTAACREAEEQAGQALAAYEQEKQSAGSAGGSEGTGDTEAALQAEYEAKQSAYEAAQAALTESRKSGARSIEDASDPLTPDSSGTITQLELEQKEEEIRRLQELKEQGGQVCAPMDAMVGAISVAVGQQTPDACSILLSGTAEDGLLCVTVSEAEAERVAVGDLATISGGESGQSSLELPLESKSPLADGSGWELRFLIPAGSFALGSYVSMVINQKNGPYDCCLPLAAIRSDGSKTFVLVMEERETSLGQEYAVVRLDVTVQISNGETAALQSGSLSGTEKVIVSSTRSIEAGDKVRPEGS